GGGAGGRGAGGGKSRGGGGGGRPRAPEAAGAGGSRATTTAPADAEKIRLPVESKDGASGPSRGPSSSGRAWFSECSPSFYGGRQALAALLSRLEKSKKNPISETARTELALAQESDN